nr:putative ribonuclease H-like domain-containing protein [Tanacetum cinerariifolium]
MRPFGCPVTILNTLDPLGKFKGKVDEGFLVGYSVNSKAFRVFNSRTSIVQETLHVNFLENKPNIAGNQPKPSAGFQDKFDAEKAGEEVTQQYMLFLVWSSGSLNHQNKDGDAAFDGNEHEVDTKKSESTVNVSPCSSDQSEKQDDKTKKKAKGKSFVESFTGNRDLSAEFEDHSDNSSNDVNAAGSIVPTAGKNSSNSTNPFSAAGLSNTTASLTHGKSTFKDASQLFDNPDMLEMEDITYTDHENVGAEADFNNLETSITIFNDDFHTCMFACFLSQEEPKKVHQAFKDPSWIEAMQEELLQFKMQKVWILVDLPHGKRAIGHTQEKGIEYEEVFAPVARIEAIRLFLAYASFMGFMVYQMDVKSAFLYGTIKEEVYVFQPSGFKDPDHPDKVYKVVKALYGLHQAPRACQDKYVAEILKKYELTKGKSASTPIDTEKPLLKDPDGEDVDVHIYRLISWQCKKQTVVAASSIEAEYVAVASCCAQVLWIQNQLLDYGHKLPLFSLMTWCCSVNAVRSSSLCFLGYIYTFQRNLNHLRIQTHTHLLSHHKLQQQFHSYTIHHPQIMSSAFADTHNMVAILTKSEASEGFDQIIDFLNGSYIKYALTVNPHIYVSCIKQFWNTVTAKQSNDVTRLQALVDRKKVVISKAVIRDVLRLVDAVGVDCLPNEDIFTGLACMGYEKPSTKITFYKAFFLSQWKFLIHTILQSMSDKRTSWNKFSSAMTSAVICLSTGRKFNFSKYIFDSLVRNVDSSSKFYMYPRFIQLIIQNQLGDLSTYTTKYTSPALTQKVFTNMRRVRKGFSGVETPLFEGVTAAIAEDVQEPSIPSTTPPPQPQDLPSTSQVQQTPLSSPQSQPQPQPQAPDFLLSLLLIALDACAALTSRIEQLESDKVVQALEITKLKKRVKRLEKGHKVKVFKLRRLKKVGTSQRVDTSDDTIMKDISNQGRMIDKLDRDEGVALMGEKKEEKKAGEVKDIAGDAQVEGRQAEIQAKIYQIEMYHASKVLSMQEDEPKVHEAVDMVTTAKLITEVVTTASTPVSAASTIIPAAEPKVLAIPTVVLVRVAAASTRRRKGVVIRDPKEESTAKIPAKTKSKDKGKGVMVEEPKPMKKKQQVELDEEYQVMKKRPQTEAQARRNMIMYSKNTAGFRLDYFNEMSYDDIQEEENRAFESINETLAQKAAKRRKLNEEVTKLYKHLEIVPDEDYDVFTEATPLARKVPVVDNSIIHLNNKPHYKIVKADGTHQFEAKSGRAERNVLRTVKDSTCDCSDDTRDSGRPISLLNYDEEENPKMDIEEEEPEEDPVEDPEPLAGHGDQFDAHPNPQPGNMNGWVDDDDVEEEDDKNKDVDIEEDDDAEIIFP